MKKILILSSLAVVLTGCSKKENNQTGVATTASQSSTTTTTQSTTTSSKSEETSTQQETTANQVKKIVAEPIVTESPLEKATNRVLSAAGTYNFDGVENTDGHVYAIHHTSNGQYLFLARKGWIAGIKYIKIFAYNESSQEFIDLNTFIQEGIASGGGFRGSLGYYASNPSKLEYVTWASASGEAEVKDLYLTRGGVIEELIYEGIITEYKNNENILGFIWNDL